MTKELIILPSLQAQRGAEGGFVLTKKFLEGAREIARCWPGQVTALVEMTEIPSAEFDLVEVPTETHGIVLEERPASHDPLVARVANAAAVLGFPSREQMALAAPCRAAGVAFVLVTEYTPETERQIMRSNTANPLLRARRLAWLWRTSHQRRRALKISAGVQCSGTPTYDLFRSIQPNAILFFDNRLRANEVASDAVCRRKADALMQGRPLRLVFGGRFAPMKGVMHLPDVARALKRRGTAFSMEIYGDGPLRDPLEARIAELGLQDNVQLCAPLDFRTGWVPVLSDKADLFVCSHIQGDPSSTYPEVMSCGVPIVGYDNVAFQGIVRQSGTGWMSPIGKPVQLADRIAELDRNRALLANSVFTGRAFAREHVFENTFRRRTEHLIEAAGL